MNLRAVLHIVSVRRAGIVRVRRKEESSVLE